MSHIFCSFHIFPYQSLAFILTKVNDFSFLYLLIYLLVAASFAGLVNWDLEVGIGVSYWTFCYYIYI